MARVADTPARWLGTELDLPAVRRDAVLAGVFSGLNVLAGTLDWKLFPAGLLFGVGIGSILHLLPAQPRPGDARRGRIAVRGITGFVGGAWAGIGVAVIASGAFVHADIAIPAPADLIPNIIVGAVTGLAWYLVWGLWETRSR